MAKKKEIIFEPGEYICMTSFYDNEKVWKANHDRLILTAQTKFEDKPELEHFSIIQKPKSVKQPFAPDLDINAEGSSHFPAGINIQKEKNPENTIPVNELIQDSVSLPEI